jgi:hypothetical protein
MLDFQLSPLDDEKNFALPLTQHNELAPLPREFVVPQLDENPQDPIMRSINQNNERLNMLETSKEMLDVELVLPGLKSAPLDMGTDEQDVWLEALRSNPTKQVCNLTK